MAKERAEKPMEKPPAPQENGEPAGEGQAYPEFKMKQWQVKPRMSR